MAKRGPQRISVSRGIGAGLTRFLVIHDGDSDGERYVNLNSIRYVSIKGVPSDPDLYDVIIEESSNYGTQWYEMDRLGAERIREVLLPGAALHVTIPAGQGGQERLRGDGD